MVNTTKYSSRLDHVFTLRSFRVMCITYNLKNLYIKSYQNRWKEANSLVFEANSLASSEFCWY